MLFRNNARIIWKDILTFNASHQCCLKRPCQDFPQALLQCSKTKRTPLREEDVLMVHVFSNTEAESYVSNDSGTPLQTRALEKYCQVFDVPFQDFFDTLKTKGICVQVELLTTDTPLTVCGESGRLAQNTMRSQFIIKRTWYSFVKTRCSFRMCSCIFLERVAAPLPWSTVQLEDGRLDFLKRDVRSTSCREIPWDLEDDYYIFTTSIKRLAGSKTNIASFLYHWVSSSLLSTGSRLRRSAANCRLRHTARQYH